MWDLHDVKVKGLNDLDAKEVGTASKVTLCLFLGGSSIEIIKVIKSFINHDFIFGLSLSFTKVLVGTTMRVMMDRS